MKKFLTLSSVIFTFSAMAAGGFDGCYVLYRPGSMAPAFCIEGTLEEGINGSNVRMAMFGTNTDNIVHCSRSSASSFTDVSFEYFLNEKREMSLAVTEVKEGRKNGDAVFGKTQLNFMQLDEATTRRLMAKAHDSVEGCESRGW